MTAATCSMISRVRRVSRVEEAAGRRQFGFCDWGMPCLGRPQHRPALLWIAALKNINVDSRIVEQLSGAMSGRINELQFGFGSRSQLSSMFVGFEPPESALKLSAVPYQRRSPCPSVFANVGESEASSRRYFLLSTVSPRWTEHPGGAQITIPFP